MQPWRTPQFTTQCYDSWFSRQTISLYSRYKFEISRISLLPDVCEISIRVSWDINIESFFEIDQARFSQLTWRPVFFTSIPVDWKRFSLPTWTLFCGSDLTALHHFFLLEMQFHYRFYRHFFFHLTSSKWSYLKKLLLEYFEISW